MLARELKHFNTAVQIAVNTPKVAWAKIGAVIAIGHTVYGRGSNSMKSHPLQKKYGIRPGMIFQHAEISAINSAIRNQVDFTRATLYVARVLQNGSIANARPCAGCEKAIRDLQIKKVIFSSDTGIEEWVI